jgi:hypothetical protein
VMRIIYRKTFSDGSGFEECDSLQKLELNESEKGGAITKLSVEIKIVNDPHLRIFFDMRDAVHARNLLGNNNLEIETTKNIIEG